VHDPYESRLKDKGTSQGSKTFFVKDQIQSCIDPSQSSTSATLALFFEDHISLAKMPPININPKTASVIMRML